MHTERGRPVILHGDELSAICVPAWSCCLTRDVDEGVHVLVDPALAPLAPVLRLDPLEEVHQHVAACSHAHHDGRGEPSDDKPITPPPRQ